MITEGEFDPDLDKKVINWRWENFVFAMNNYFKDLPELYAQLGVEQSDQILTKDSHEWNAFCSLLDYLAVGKPDIVYDAMLESPRFLPT